MAMARVARVAPGEAWLEGIRVDPRVRGMNVATDSRPPSCIGRRLSVPGSCATRRASETRGPTGWGAAGFTKLATFANWWWTQDPESDPDLPSSFTAEVA